jgi:hypothetical protein
MQRMADNGVNFPPHNLETLMETAKQIRSEYIKQILVDFVRPLRGVTLVGRVGRFLRLLERSENVAFAQSK